MTAFFALSDQAQDNPPRWGDGFQGYLRRTSSRYGEWRKTADEEQSKSILNYEQAAPQIAQSRIPWPRQKTHRLESGRSVSLWKS